MTDTPTYEAGQQVRLVCDPQYQLGVMRSLGQTRFDGAVDNGTVGTYKGRYDDLLTHPDSVRLGRHWHVVEVDVDGETMLAPLGEGSFEPAGEATDGDA